MTQTRPMRRELGCPFPSRPANRLEPGGAWGGGEGLGSGSGFLLPLQMGLWTQATWVPAGLWRKEIGWEQNGRVLDSLTRAPRTCPGQNLLIFLLPHSEGTQ